MSPKSRKQDQKIEKKNECRFSVFPVFVCGPFNPLVSTLGQSGPSIFWNMLKCSQETRRDQSFGARSGASASKPQPSSLKIKMKALIVFFRTRQKWIPDVSAKTWRRTFRQKNIPKRLRLKTFAETFRMICGAYPVYARSPSPSQRPAATTIASRSPFPLGLCSCSTSLSKMGK